MDWIQFTLFAFGMAGAFGWQNKQMQREYGRTEANLQVIRNEVKENSRETRDLIAAIHQEMKDFHGRLCAIEERNRGK